MMDEQLRKLLEQIDPMPVDESVDSTQYQTLLEDIMNTPLDTDPVTSQPHSRPARTSRGFQRLPIVIGGIAAAVAAVIGTVAITRSSEDPETRQSLAIADTGTTMSSCVPFDVSILAGMPVAFAGTVTNITDTSVTVDVDRWFTTATTETALVDIALPAANTSASLDGVEFIEGERYLLTATDGTINGCGFSGPATAELEATFTSAFGG